MNASINAFSASQFYQLELISMIYMSINVLIGTKLNAATNALVNAITGGELYSTQPTICIKQNLFEISKSRYHGYPREKNLCVDLLLDASYTPNVFVYFKSRYGGKYDDINFINCNCTRLVLSKLSATHRGTWCQKQVSMEWLSHYIPKNIVDCNYLAIHWIPASGAKILNYTHAAAFVVLVVICSRGPFYKHTVKSLI